MEHGGPPQGTADGHRSPPVCGTRPTKAVRPHDAERTTPSSRRGTRPNGGGQARRDQPPGAAPPASQQSSGATEQATEGELGRQEKLLRAGSGLGGARSDGGGERGSAGEDISARRSAGEVEA